MTNYNERLDEILYAHNDAIKSLHHKIRYQDCKLTPDELLGMEEAVSAKAKQAIIDWHNKQIEAVLDRLESLNGSHPDSYIATFIETERNRLNPSKSTPFNKLKESK